MAEWIIPCNGKNYDVDSALRDLRIIEWHQSKALTNAQVGDTLYIYESTPVQSICWRCRITDSHRMVSRINDCRYYIPPVPDDTHFDGPFLEIKAEYEFTVGDKLSYSNLKQNGMKSRIQGPLRLNAEVSAYMHKIEKLQNSPDEQQKDAESLSESALERLTQRYSQQPVRMTKYQTIAYSRNPYISEYVKRCAKGICQLCNEPAPFQDQKGQPYLETHHIVWLSRGGEDSINNCVAHCPNCHRKMHIIDDPKDIAILRNGR